MYYDMKKWIEALPKSKKALPILSCPSIKLLGVSVKEIINSAELQAKGIKAVADRVDSAASVSLMDLSVEAECFGATVRFSEDEVPSVTGRLVGSEEQANALVVPKVGSARSGIYVDAIRRAVTLINDRPVLAGMIGPFSLAARLMDVTEIMMDCYDDPDTVHIVMEKATEFLINYAKAYKEAGANGIMLAEPVAGLLSPALEQEFASPYVKKIVDAVQTDDFVVIYHNCGAGVPVMVKSIASTGCAGYHFGNAVSMKEMLDKMPSDVPVMGNVDPASQFRLGTPQSVKTATAELLKECSRYDNFVISSGCDIPPESPWENIDAFFEAVKEYGGNE